MKQFFSALLLMVGFFIEAGFGKPESGGRALSSGYLDPGPRVEPTNHHN